MLSRLYIKNIALIEEADIQFDAHVNVLSGETGAGKSVILDSLNFVLGSKADKSMIRHGESQSLVKAEFLVNVNSLAAAALAELDIECDDGCIIITRKYNVDGKGSIKINGNSVTATMLKSVTSKLVDVHGQSEHFYLLNEGNQLQMIDSLCVGISDFKEQLSCLIKQNKEIMQEIKALGGNGQERERTCDLLSYQINEIEQFGVRIGEYDELKARQNILNNTEKILTAVNAVRNILCDDGGCTDLISLALRQINSVSHLSGEYEKISSRLENVNVEMQDIGETVGDLADGLVYDGQEATYLDERIGGYKNLKKKYGETEEEILTFLENAKNKLYSLQNAADALEKLHLSLTACEDKIYALCLKLTDIRKNCSLTFCKNVEEQLKSLNIADAKFTVEFNRYDRGSADLNNHNGADQIRFMFSANKGEPLKELSKIISGGEMSRFMLAVKTQLKDLNGISTYVFDEIDAGISGYTALAVARKFADIGKNTQIIAVSHLPQVCASSNAQFYIYKTEEDDKTVTKIKKLSEDERIDEIVRLTGSVESSAARQHAKELISKFR